VRHLSEQDSDLAEARRLAARLGLSRLTEGHLRELADGIAANRSLAARLPRDLHPADEPAHIYRFAPKETGKS